MGIGNLNTLCEVLLLSLLLSLVRLHNQEGNLALIPSFILVTWLVHLNLLDLIALTIIGERRNEELFTKLTISLRFHSCLEKYKTKQQWHPCSNRTNIFMDSLITRIKQTNQLIIWLMKPGGSMPRSQGLLIIPILSRINPLPRIDTYFFKIHSNIVLEIGRASCRERV